MSGSKTSLEILITEINILRKENDALKKKLSLYENVDEPTVSEDGEKTAKNVTQKWNQNQKVNKQKANNQLSAYEQQQMKFESYIRRQRFRDNYSI